MTLPFNLDFATLSFQVPMLLSWAKVTTLRASTWIATIANMATSLFTVSLLCVLQLLGVIFPANDWATILPSRTTRVSVANSYMLSAVSAVHRTYA